MNDKATDEAVLAAGMDAVLGVGGGDYTAERHQWLDGLTDEDVIGRALANQAERERSAVPA